MATLDVSPTKVRPSRVQTITFIGAGTTWTGSAPTFTPSGVAGVSAGSVTVVSDTVATAPVTYGAAVGLVTWTDSTTSATKKQLVSTLLFAKWTPPRR
jgi:hypothetical protein